MANYNKQYEEVVKMLDEGGTHTRIAESVGVSQNVVQRWSWVHSMGPTIENEFKRRGALPDALIRSLAKAQTHDVVEFGRIWTAFQNGTWQPSEPMVYVVTVSGRRKPTVRTVVVVAIGQTMAETLALAQCPAKYTVRSVTAYDPAVTGIVYMDVE